MKITLDVAAKYTESYRKFLDNTSKGDKALKELNQERDKAASIKGDLDRFQSLNSRLKNHDLKLSEAALSTKQLGKEIANTKNPTKKQLAQFERSKEHLKKLKSANLMYRQELNQLNTVITKNGLSTKDMSKSQKIATLNIKKQTKALEKQKEMLEKVNKLKESSQMWGERAASFRGYGSRGMGTAGAIAGGIVGAGVAGLHMINQDTVQDVRIAESFGMSHSDFKANDHIGKLMGRDGEMIADLQEELGNKLGELYSAGSNTALDEFAADVGGFDFAALKGKSSQEQFSALMDKISKIEDADKRQYHMDAILGGEGAKLSNYLDSVGKSYVDLKKESMNYNLTTKEGIAGAKAYGDAQLKLTSIVGSAASEMAGLLGGELAPVLNDAADGISELFINNKDVIREFVGDIGDGLRGLIQFIGDNSETVGTIAKWGGYMIAFSGATKVASFMFSGLSTAMMVARGAMATFTAAQGALNLAMSANPIGLIVVGIGAAIAAGVALYKNWDLVTSWMSKAWGGLSDGIVDGANWAVEKVIAIFDVLTEVFMAPIRALNYIQDKALSIGGEFLSSLNPFADDENEKAKQFAPNTYVKERQKQLAVSNNNQYSIVVNGGTGDPRDIAKQVRSEIDKINKHERVRARGSYSD